MVKYLLGYTNGFFITNITMLLHALYLLVVKVDFFHRIIPNLYPIRPDKDPKIRLALEIAYTLNPRNVRPTVSSITPLPSQ